MYIYSTMDVYILRRCVCLHACKYVTTDAWGRPLGRHCTWRCPDGAAALHHGRRRRTASRSLTHCRYCRHTAIAIIAVRQSLSSLPSLLPLPSDNHSRLGRQTGIAVVAIIADVVVIQSLPSLPSDNHCRLCRHCRRQCRQTLPSPPLAPLL